MKFESEIVYRLPMTLNEMYIRRFYDALNIKEFYNKEVKTMDFDLEKIKAFYADVLAKRDEAVAVALADKEAIVAERFELAKEDIAKEVEAELIAKAEEPFKHDIELCESFFADKAEEVVAEEKEVEEVGGEF